MSKEVKYYIVAANALPEVFIKVAEAKRMMQTGEADTVGDATKKAGISRSAFYKYKDSVQPFNDMKSEHIITFYCMLKDNTGVLSSVLSVFATSGANILTINQSIPTNGCAAVTISLVSRTTAMVEKYFGGTLPVERAEGEFDADLIAAASAVEGVIRFEIMAG